MRPRFTPGLWGTFAVVCLTLSCPRPTGKPDGGRLPECDARADCADGQICTPERYCDRCSSSGQCSVKEVCSPDAGRCALRAGWGAECTRNEECPAGAWCRQGLCQDRSQVSLCPLGLNSECPQGDRCNRMTTVCEEDLGCSNQEDCSTAETCNTGSHQCVPRCTVETQAQICDAQERCVGEKCVQCAADSDCGAGLRCDAAGRCSAGVRCYSDRDCQIPLVCFARTGACLPPTPPCLSNDACLADERCDVGSGRCVPKNCQADRYEPNNDHSHAFLVSAGSYRHLTLCPSDVDWYAVGLSRGDQLGVNVDADPFSENTFSTFIADANGRTLAGGRLLVSYVAPAAARYFVVVRSSDSFQPYDVTFLISRGIPCDDDRYEANDSPSQATALNLATDADAMVCPQDQDWFRAQLSTDRGLRASLINYDSGRGLLRLCVASADGSSQRGCSESTAPVVELSAAALGGERSALIRVSGVDERAANSYTLRVERP